MKEIIVKKCKRHGETEHAYYNNRLRCKKCMVEYDYNKRHKIKAILVEYKGGKCEVCNYNKCLNALDFHHIIPEEKSFVLNTANFNKSLKRLKEEADKCMLVCSNCHREIHYNENENKRKELIYEEVHRETAISSLNFNNIKNDINEGMTQNDIAKKYNVSISTIKRFFQKYNISKKHFTCDKESFLNSFKENPSYSYLCKKYNISRKVVRNFSVRNNLIEEMNKIREERKLKPLSNKKLE